MQAWNKLLRCRWRGAIRVSFILHQRPAWRNHVSVACHSAELLFWPSATGRKNQRTLTTSPPHTHTHTPFFCLPEKLVPFVDTAWVVTTSCAYSNMRLEKKDLHVAVAAALVNRAGRRCEAVTATMIERPSFVKCTCWKWIAVACSSMWFMEGNSSFCSLCPQPFAVFI